MVGIHPDIAGLFPELTESDFSISEGEDGADEEVEETSTSDHISSPASFTSSFDLSAEAGKLFKSPPRRGRRFKGVRHRKWGRFVCEIRDAIGKRIWLGSHDSETHAARVYDEAARILQGPGAWLNFPHDSTDDIALPADTVKALIEHRAHSAQRLMSQKQASAPASPTKRQNTTEALNTQDSHQAFKRIKAAPSAESSLMRADSACSESISEASEAAQWLLGDFSDDSGALPWEEACAHLLADDDEQNPRTNHDQTSDEEWLSFLA